MHKSTLYSLHKTDNENRTLNIKKPLIVYLMGIDLFAIFVPQPLKELPGPYLTPPLRVSTVMIWYDAF